MFELCTESIDAHAWQRSGGSEQSGALVTFEGRVRVRNAGRAVERLEYEGAAALAANEFTAIEQEALAQFDIEEVRCLHRVGTLAIGETAVWIGVWAPHRGDAFAACRYVIDELKQRLPIWKKEHYADGDSGWINTP